MKNPKIRIESDGKNTQMFVDGKEVDGMTFVSFEADGESVICEYEKLKTNKEGFVLDTGKEVVTENHKFVF